MYALKNPSPFSKAKLAADKGQHRTAVLLQPCPQAVSAKAGLPAGVRPLRLEACSHWRLPQATADSKDAARVPEDKTMLNASQVRFFLKKKSVFTNPPGSRRANTRIHPASASPRLWEHSAAFAPCPPVSPSRDPPAQPGICTPAVRAENKTTSTPSHASPGLGEGDVSAPSCKPRL